MQRDLEIGAIDGGGALSAESVLPVAQACRPKTVLEEGGANVITLNPTGAAHLPIWDGSVSATSGSLKVAHHLIGAALDGEVISAPPSAVLPVSATAAG